MKKTLLLTLILSLKFFVNSQTLTKIEKSCNDYMCLETTYSEIICNGGESKITNVVTGGVAPYTYVYLNLNGTKVDTTASTSINFKYVLPGYHRVRVTDSEGHTIETKISNQTYSWFLIQDSIKKMIIKEDIILPNDKKAKNGKIKILEVQNSTNPLSYLWSDGSTKYEIKKLKIGQYSVEITDSNKCTITKEYNLSKFEKSLTQVDRSLVEDSVINLDKIYLGLNYPNPSINLTKIQYIIPLGSDAKLYFTDERGKVRNFILDPNKNILEINPKDFSNGLYYYFLFLDGKIIKKDYDGNNISSFKMIIKND